MREFDEETGKPIAHYYHLAGVVMGCGVTGELPSKRKGAPHGAPVTQSLFRGSLLAFYLTQLLSLDNRHRDNTVELD